MINLPKCQELFAFNSFFFAKLFDGIEYPWEIIPLLKERIEAILSQTPKGYERINERVVVGKGARIASSVKIEGTAIIGANADIRHCAFLRGSVIIGDGCVVGNSCEIKNSVMMDGAQAPHFNYVGDSVLGEKAHIGAGVICSNLRSDGKSVRIRTDEVAYDTGLRKLGAILGDRAEIGCGAVLCPGAVIGAGASVYPLTCARGVYPGDSIVKDCTTVIAKA